MCVCVYIYVDLGAISDSEIHKNIKKYGIK